jgi:hypothetical protein
VGDPARRGAARGSRGQPADDRADRGGARKAAALGRREASRRASRGAG